MFARPRKVIDMGQRSAHFLPRRSSLLPRTHLLSSFQALFYEKARSFIALVKSPLPLYGLDIPASVLSTLTLDTSWLSPTPDSSSGAVASDHAHGSSSHAHAHSGHHSHSSSGLPAPLNAAGGVDVWRAVKGLIPQPGYAVLVREELREAWEDDSGAGACWLFSLREEKGLLLVWPPGGGGSGGASGKR